MCLKMKFTLRKLNTRSKPCQQVVKEMLVEGLHCGRSEPFEKAIPKRITRPSVLETRKYSYYTLIVSGQTGNKNSPLLPVSLVCRFVKIYLRTSSS